MVSVLMGRGKGDTVKKIYGKLARLVYELGRRMLGLVLWDQPWVNADDPKMVAWLQRRMQS